MAGSAVEVRRLISVGPEEQALLKGVRIFADIVKNSGDVSPFRRKACCAHEVSSEVCNGEEVLLEGVPCVDGLVRLAVGVCALVGCDTGHVTRRENVTSVF